MKKSLIIFFILLSNFALAEEITIYTESFPPLNFKKDGKITGFATELVQEILKRTKVKANIQLVPWKRGYHLALTKKNTMIYSIVKTDSRTKLFKWVGPIYPRRTALFKLKKNQDIQVKSLEEAKKIKVGVVKGYANTQWLVKNGFTKLDYAINDNNNVKKFFAGRFPFIVGTDLTFQSRLKKLGHHEREVERVIILEDKDQQFLGFNLETPDSLVDKFQKSFMELKKDGFYKKIKEKYKL